MNPIKPRRLIRILLKHGFINTRIKGSHYRFVHPDGRKITVPVHGDKEIGIGLLRKIARDAELTKENIEE